MNIRKFTKSHIDQILFLQNEWFESGVLPSYVNRLIEGTFTEDNTIVIEANNIIGYSVFTRRSIDEYEIEFLYISKNERKKEIGKKLLNSTEIEIKRLGGQKIILSPTTNRNQDNLINYYKKLGYSREDDRIFGGVAHKIMSKMI